MKTTRHFFRTAVFAAALMLAAGMPAGLQDPRSAAPLTAFAEEQEYTFAENDQFSYKKYSDHIAVLSAKNSGDTLEIPSQIDGLPVTEIDIYGFQLCTMKTLILPDTLEHIGPYAFAFCENLTTLNMPESLKKIDFHAFEYCKALTEINFPDHLVQTGDFTFDETPWLDAQRKKDPLVIVNGAVIDGRACEGDVVIPSGVKYMASGAFSRNDKLTSVVVPASVDSIQENTFFYCENLKSAEINGAKYLGNAAFAYCSKMTDLKLSGKLTKIDPDAFRDNTASATITFYGSQSAWNAVEKSPEDEFLKRANMVFDESHQDPPDETAGDLDGDGRCSMADVVLLQKYLLTTGTLTAEQAKIADMNADNKLTAADLTLLKQTVIASR